MTARQVKRSHTLHPARSYRGRVCIALGAAREVPPVRGLACARARGPLRVRGCERVRVRVRPPVCVGVCACVRVHALACVRACVRALACVTRGGVCVACVRWRAWRVCWPIPRQTILRACRVRRPFSAHFGAFRVIGGVCATANWRVCWCWRDSFALKSMKCRKFCGIAL